MLQEIMGHASITTTRDLYPGEMDRYVDRRNEAARMSDVADDAAKNAAR
jgi:integrase